MNLPFSFRQKIKIALFLFSIMACTVIIRVLEDQSLKTMGSAFSSIYNDRLVPATDLFQISEEVYAKRHLIEAYNEQSLGEGNPMALSEKLIFLNTKLDSLLHKYESTYLVEKESIGLIALKNQLKKISFLEQAIISGNNHSLIEINAAFDHVSLRISHLAKIQSSVGEELIKNTQKNLMASKVYSGIQFALAILVGVLIISILLAANVIKVKTSTFSLN
jgi:hypothetical protein